MLDHAAACCWILCLLAPIEQADPSAAHEVSPQTTRAWTAAGARLENATRRRKLGLDWNPAAPTDSGLRMFVCDGLDSLAGLPEPEAPFGLRVSPEKLLVWLPTLQGFRHLRWIEVRNPAWSANEVGQLSQLPAHIELTISYLQATPETKPSIRALAGLKHPWTLDLQALSVRDETLAALGPLPALRGLYLSSLRDDGQGLKAFPQLAVLSIHNGSVSRRGLPALAELKNLTHLEVSYTDAGEDLLDAVRNLPRLAHLNLEKSSVSAEGLNTLKHLPALKWLSLRSSRVSMEPLESLSALEYLNVVGGTFELGEMTGLAKLKNLKMLVVESYAEEQRLAPLRQALPNCQIVREP